VTNPCPPMSTRVHRPAGHVRPSSPPIRGTDGHPERTDSQDNPRLHPAPSTIRHGLLDTIGDCRDARNRSRPRSSPELSCSAQTRARQAASPASNSARTRTSATAAMPVTAAVEPTTNTTATDPCTAPVGTDHADNGQRATADETPTTGLRFTASVERDHDADLQRPAPPAPADTTPFARRSATHQRGHAIETTTPSTATDDAGGKPLHPVPPAVTYGVLDCISDCRDALLALQLDDDPHAAVVLLTRAARRAQRLAASLASGDVR